ncbi:hypothetical protein A2997_00525 [Candidatus Nomurabacteria bacterium RIFCSPLOWO2_01_FULL_36_10b]|uniref:Oxidoreductase n=1 Tax=Candidatus Nomurabacteria bacterium RIFCSPLOWO2_01_FULL_36_10b TaxID=1801766 RepID=A0A1F6WQ42_9BACT|nr:MAG: hypothetical protein A2997_00525 [Candidatus Nomurabacteria bacterium RIFCSPLOWO2_01_FULL_36_10b]
MKTKTSKNFLITGITGVIGKAIHTYILENIPDAKIFLVSRSNKIKIQENASLCHLPNIDLTNETDLHKLKHMVDEFFGNEIFHVINCAGGYVEHTPFEDVSLSEAKRVISENLFTVYGMAHTMVPLMRKRSGGHFIVFGCNSIKYNYPYMAEFTCSKAAVASLMKSLASECSKDGLQFNTFHLVTVKSEKEKECKPRGDHQNWLEPSDIADAVISFTQQKNNLHNGGEMQLMIYSQDYWERGYFERIKK